jgi:hypothetical protein
MIAQNYVKVNSNSPYNIMGIKLKYRSNFVPDGKLVKNDREIDSLAICITLKFFTYTNNPNKKKKPTIDCKFFLHSFAGQFFTIIGDSKKFSNT